MVSVQCVFGFSLPFSVGHVVVVVVWSMVFKLFAKVGILLTNIIMA